MSYYSSNIWLTISYCFDSHPENLLKQHHARFKQDSIFEYYLHYEFECKITVWHKPHLNRSIVKIVVKFNLKFAVRHLLSEVLQWNILVSDTVSSFVAIGVGLPLCDSAVLSWSSHWVDEEMPNNSQHPHICCVIIRDGIAGGGSLAFGVATDFLVLSVHLKWVLFFVYSRYIRIQDDFHNKLPFGVSPQTWHSSWH